MVLVFKYIQRPGVHIREPLVVEHLIHTHVPTDAVRNLAEIDVLPITLSNETDVDPDDGQTYTSAYLLNREFDFVDLVTPSNLGTVHHADVGPLLLICHTYNVSAFVGLFGYLGVKLAYTFSVLAHQKIRAGPVIARTESSINDMEDTRVARAMHRAELRRAEAEDGESLAPREPLSRREAAEDAASIARQRFPYIAPANHIRQLAETCQGDMEPRKWIPAPCALTFAKNKQPVDALANFQYYARQELPPDVRQAVLDGM
ncbi:hypothetical protein B0H17DRAFT_1133134 [Mycena rosella]|uniref:Uncharacterized protein n=1 Tax=Mycena rosella TaxID=1033263 RepID=A0AAD7DIA7_MYCRO|nr:hypothetical protein B0H17DRAFT_1133134 [Mycena rosella]